MLIKIKFLPLKYLINPAAGYTTREVPPIIKVSQLEINLMLSLIILSSRPSSYKTTSGLTIAPHFLHFGIGPSSSKNLETISSGEKFLFNFSLKIPFALLKSGIPDSVLTPAPPYGCFKNV